LVATVIHTHYLSSQIGVHIHYSSQYRNVGRVKEIKNVEQQRKAHANEINVQAILGMHTIASALPQIINFMTFFTLHIPLRQVQMFDNGVL